MIFKLCASDSPNIPPLEKTNEYSVCDKVNIACMVLFALMLAAPLFYPLYTTVGTPVFYIACLGGGVGLIGLVASSIIFCVNKPEPEIIIPRKQIGPGEETVRTEKPQEAPDRPKIEKFDGSSSSTHTSGIFDWLFGTTKPNPIGTLMQIKTDIELPDKLKTPFSLKLWSIALNEGGTEVADGGEICPKLYVRLNYNTFTDRYTVEMGETVQVLDMLIEELTLQKKIYRKNLEENFSKGDSAAKINKLDETIDHLIKDLGYRKNVLKEYSGELTAKQKNKLTDDVFKCGTLFKPLKAAMDSIESDLGITQAFVGHLLALITGTVNQADRNELQSQAEICRNFFSARSPRFNIERFDQKNEAKMFARLFERFFEGYEFTVDPFNGLEDSLSVKFIQMHDLTDRVVRSDQAIQGSYGGEQWVILSFGSGSSQSGGHYTNQVYNPVDQLYYHLDNMSRSAASITGAQFFKKIGGANPFKKAVKKGDRAVAEKYDLPNADRECVIMELHAFEEHKQKLKLPTVTPAYYQNNCYLATALVRLAAYYQAACLVSQKTLPQ